MLFRQIEGDFQAARRSGGLSDVFDGWRVHEPALSHYSDPDALIDTSATGTAHSNLPTPRELNGFI